MIPLRDSKTTGRFPIVTVLLILLNIYVFYLEVTSTNLDAIFGQYALIPSLVNFGNPLTLLQFITSMFLHGGLLHILSNMWFLWIFGDNVEQRMGWLYLPTYLLGGIIGGLAQYFFMPESPIPIVGASGAVATILGAYLIYFPRHTVSTLVPIFFIFTIVDIPAFAVLAFWFLTQLFSGHAALTETVANAGGGVAYFAHIGGFLYGIIAAYIIGNAKVDTKHHA
jgi:membrane associated rhomboid family serine protease